MSRFVPPTLNYPMGSYRVLVADCPWRYRNKKTGGSHNSGAGQKYPTMELEELMMMRGWIEAAMFQDSVCFLWAVNPLLPQAFTVLRAWDFSFTTMLTWHKDSARPGTGYWFRGVTEHVLFGVRGNVPAFRSNVENLVKAPVRGHSVKPFEFFDHIEPAIRLMRPRLELFARRMRPGWDGGVAPMADAKGGPT